MKSSFIREVTLYRYRYVVGYIAFGVLLLLLLVLGIEQVPRGLSNDEMASAVVSVNVNVIHPILTNVVDAPYHLLQKGSIHLLGLTPFAIKLPSVLLGAVTGVMLIFMLRRWFKTNVAIITALIVATSVGFLAVARTGTPMIMPTFWTVILLLAATHMLHAHTHRFFWKLVCLGSLALLAYSPFGIYPVIALSIAGILHPHVRYRLRQGSWWKNLLIALSVALLMTPLIIACVHTPHIALQLLGADKINFEWDRIGPTIWMVGAQLFNFTTNHAGLIVTPLFNVATTILLLLGFLKLCTATYSARSYMLFIWLLLLIPVLILRPDALLLVLVPSTLILAIGIETLIRQWYDLFPRNPYARIGALIPLGVLVMSMTAINTSRYFLSHHYNRDASAFHAELPAVQKVLKDEKLGKNKTATIVVPREQMAFYDLLRRQYPKIVIRSHTTDAPTQIVLREGVNALESTIPTRIVTDDRAGDRSLLLRVYTK